MNKLGLTILVFFLSGCGSVPKPQAPAAQSALAHSAQTPEEQCKARSSGINVPEDPQGSALLRTALYDDCLISFRTDPQEIATLRHLGQIEALKGYVSMRSGSFGKDELIQTRIIATADLDTLFNLFELLKMSGKFSETDLRKFDETLPHLQIADAFHDYERRSSGKYGRN